MVVQDVSALIFYNDSNIGSHEQDYRLAQKVADSLKEYHIASEIRGYSANIPDNDTYQSFILIYSHEIHKSPQMIKTVDTAIERATERRAGEMLVITTSPSDLSSDPRWNVLRQYDASNEREEAATLEGVRDAIYYRKIPYTQARALPRSQRGRHLAVSAPGQTSNRVNIRVLLVAALTVLMVIAAIGGVYFLNRPLSPLPPQTHTPVPLSPAQETATAEAQALNVRQNEYNTITNMPLAIQDFHSQDQWDTTANNNSSCILNSNQYKAHIAPPDKYTFCLEQNTNYTNLALQVSLQIAGDAGGVVFRDNKNTGSYYRFAINQSVDPKTDYFYLFRCDTNSPCSPDGAQIGTQISPEPAATPVTATPAAPASPPATPATNPSSTPVPVSLSVQDHNNPITITVIAQDNNIDVYVYNNFLARFTDPTPGNTLTGNIGMYAASLGNPTDVTFSNLKVWTL